MKRSIRVKQLLALLMVSVMLVMVGCGSSDDEKSADGGMTSYTGDSVKAMKDAVEKSKGLDNYRLSLLTRSTAENDYEEDQEIFNIYTGDDGAMMIDYLEQECCFLDDEYSYEKMSYSYYNGKVSFSSSPPEDDDIYIEKTIMDRNFVLADALLEECNLTTDGILKAFERMYELELEAQTNNAGEIIIKAKNPGYEKFVSVHSAFTKQFLSEEYKDCKFGISVTINADGYITDIRLDIGNMPVDYVDGIDNMDWSFNIKAEEIGKISAIEQPEWVESAEISRLNCCEGDIKARYNYEEELQGLMFLGIECEETEVEQYVVSSKVDKYEVKSVGSMTSPMGTPYKVYRAVIPSGVTLRSSGYTDADQVFFEDSKADVEANYKNLYDSDFDEDRKYSDELYYFAGEWSYVDGVATPN